MRPSSASPAGPTLREHREPCWELRVAGTNVLVANHAQMAASLMTRMIGLMGRRTLPGGTGLVLEACRAIHTCFMRFPIDAVFVNQAWSVVAIREAIPPWRMTPVVWRAQAVIELPAGTVRKAGVRVGDVVTRRPAQPEDRGVQRKSA